VTPAFLSDFLVCQNTKQILPDPKQYIPPLSESTINANDVSLAVRKERQQVNNLMFVTLKVVRPNNIQK